MYIKEDIMPQEKKDKIFEYGKQMIRALDKKAAKTPISPMTIVNQQKPFQNLM